MEVFVKVPGPAFSRELKELFGEVGKEEGLTVAVFLQDSCCDLIEVRGNEVKDGCLERFFGVAERLRGELKGFWCDYIDPASGLPVLTDSCRILSDVEVCIRLLQMEYVTCGGCGMVKHDKFGYGVYPSTFITNAPRDQVFSALGKIFEDEEWNFVNLMP